MFWGLRGGVAAGVLALFGCSGTSSTTDPLQGLAASGQNRAEQAASLLSAGSASEDKPGNLKAVVSALRRMGVQPVSGYENTLARWQQQLLSAGLDEVTNDPFRGRLLGPAYLDTVARPGERVSLQQSFTGGQKATVSVSAVNEKADLVLFVTQQDGDILCQTTLSQSPSCSWVPLFSQRLRIDVLNTTETEQRVFIVID